MDKPIKVKASELRVGDIIVPLASSPIGHGDTTILAIDYGSNYYYKVTFLDNGAFAMIHRNSYRYVYRQEATK